jgi:hypothetical protein
MSTTHVAERRTWRKWFLGIVKTLGILAGIGLLLWGISIVGWNLREEYGRMEMRKQIALLSEQGVPVSGEDLDKLYRERTSDTQTDEWIRLIDLLRLSRTQGEMQGVAAFTRDSFARFVAEGEWVEEEATKRYIEGKQEWVKDVTTLAAYETPPYIPVVFDMIPEAFDKTARFVELGHLICAHGLLAIRDGNSNSVRSDIETLFKLAHVCEVQPSEVATLVSGAISELAYNLLKLGLESDRIENDELVTLLPLFKAKSLMEIPWQQFVHSERAILIPQFLHPEKVFNKLKAGPPEAAAGWNCLHYLRMAKKAEELNWQNCNSLYREAVRLNFEFTQIRKGGMLPSYDTEYSKRCLPSVDFFAGHFLDEKIRLQLGAFAIAIRLYQKEFGRFPANLEVLKDSGLDLNLPCDKKIGYELGTDQSLTFWGLIMGGRPRDHSKPPTHKKSDFYLDKWQAIHWWFCSPSESKSVRTPHPNSIVEDSRSSFEAYGVDP